MRKTTVGLTLALVASLIAVALLVGGGGQPVSAGPPPGLPGLGNHYEQLTFTLSPGGSQSFALPAAALETGAPVRIEVSFSAHNAGTQTPSEIMYAIVNRDPVSEQVTWVGTSNDGTQAGSNSLDGTNIANIYGGASPTVNVSLDVDDPAAGTLKLTQNANTTSVDGYYIVNVWQ